MIHNKIERKRNAPLHSKTPFENKTRIQKF